MLALIFAAVWFGYRAYKAKRNPIGWGLIGILAFGILKVLVTVVAVSSNIRSQEEAEAMFIVFNILLFGGTFLLGFLIQPAKDEDAEGVSDQFHKVDVSEIGDDVPQDVRELISWINDNIDKKGAVAIDYEKVDKILNHPVGTTKTNIKKLVQSYEDVYQIEKEGYSTILLKLKTKEEP